MPRQKATTAKSSASGNPPAAEAKKRAYNSPLREQQIAETKERAIAAGAELIRGYESWDWKNLNAAAVARRAGLGKRTVQRYFPTEKILRDAVLQRLVEESGVQFSDIELGEYGDTVEKVFRYLQSFALSHAYPYDPTVETLDQQGRDRLLEAIARARPDWPEARHVAAAALLDIFWQPPLFERMTTTWGMDREYALAAIKWLVQMIENAISEDQVPGPPSGP